MIKRYCDWCGAEIEIEYHNIEIKGRHYHNATVITYYEEPLKNLELCEKCYQNFNNYLNKKDS